MAIRNFANQPAEELASGLDNKRTRKLLPQKLHRNALKKLQLLRAARRLDDVASFPGLHLEKLKGAPKEVYSIRINNQFRICFRWIDGDTFDVAIEDYH